MPICAWAQGRPPELERPTLKHIPEENDSSSPSRSQPPTALPAVHGRIIPWLDLTWVSRRQPQRLCVPGDDGFVTSRTHCFTAVFLDPWLLKYFCFPLRLRSQSLGSGGGNIDDAFRAEHSGTDEFFSAPWSVANLCISHLLQTGSSSGEAFQLYLQ